MAGKVFELPGGIQPDQMAKTIAQNWSDWYFQKSDWMESHNELRNYLFATDTSTTTNNTLPWRNTTTIPKLSQIRDNLHSNYIESLMPNDSWLRWESYTTDTMEQQKKHTIEAYMANKTRQQDFRPTMSQLLYDYIDYGNVFATTDYVHKTRTDVNGEEHTIYSGPIVRRIHPFDIVFNLTAPSFEESPIITRSIMSVGEFAQRVDEATDKQAAEEVLEKVKAMRAGMSGTSLEDTKKYEGIEQDGFGNFWQYLMSGHVELLTFQGNLYDPNTGEYHPNRKVVVADRSFVLSDEEIPDAMGRNVFHTGWRKRTNNLWCMGPLDNLVGMQYRIDHLENIKADVFDLIAYPPLKITGDVDEFEWAPGAEIHIDEGGNVEMLAPPTQALQADFQIRELMDKMELLAGAPREAMGVRSPGEKTAFEVQQLLTAAGRIFQEKITHFEIELLEKQLNKMLEAAQRNMKVEDVIRIMDDDIGAEVFTSITANDITANGKIRPVGARHFAKQAKDLRSLAELFQTPVGEMVRPHTSAIEMTKFIDDTLGLQGYDLFVPNIAVKEQESTAVEQGISAENVEAQLDPANAPELPEE